MLWARAMGTNYRPDEPDQPFLFPPSPRDWLPRDHLAYFSSDTLDQLDLSALHQRPQKSDLPDLNTSAPDFRGTDS